MTNFFGFGLDPDCKLLHKFKMDWIWTELMEKNCVIFIVEKLYFVNFLYFIWTWTFNLKFFWAMVELELNDKNSGLGLNHKIFQSGHLYTTDQNLTFQADSQPADIFGGGITVICCCCTVTFLGKLL